MKKGHIWYKQSQLFTKVNNVLYILYFIHRIISQFTCQIYIQSNLSIRYYRLIMCFCKIYNVVSYRSVLSTFLGNIFISIMLICVSWKKHMFTYSILLYILYFIHRIISQFTCQIYIQSNLSIRSPLFSSHL
jgi:phosphatidylglycerophosphate synthase